MRTCLALALFAIALTACSDWKKIAAVPPDSVYTKPHSYVRVVTKDGKAIILGDAGVLGDSLVGRFEETEPPHRVPIKAGARYAIAVSSIDHVDALKKKANHGWIILVALGLILIAAIPLAQVSSSLP